MIYIIKIYFDGGREMPAKINKTKFAILGMLNMAPMSGYDIKKMTEKSVGFFWNENFGHIYPILKRLEKEGLALRKSENTEHSPRRNVYTITPPGKKLLAAWLTEPVSEQPIRCELLLKLFFGGNARKQDLVKLILSEKRQQEEMLARLEEIGAHITHKKSKDRPFWLFTLNYGLRKARMTLSWCEETLSALERKDAAE